MMTPPLCPCGRIKTMHKLVSWCEHCDEPCAKSRCNNCLAYSHNSDQRVREETRKPKSGES